MPPTPKPPENKDPQGEIPKKPQEGEVIDIDKILLPKKEIPGHTTQSAERINAGALLEQEIKAGVEGPRPEHAPLPPIPPPTKPKEELQSLETYQGDIEKLVKEKNVSTVSIAAAEAGRRTATPVPASVPSDSSALLKRIAIIVGTLFFTFGAITILVLAFSRSTPSVFIPQPEAPFILIDDVQTVTYKSGQFTHSTLLKTLADKKNKSSLSLGLMAGFYLAISGPGDNNTNYSYLPASQLFPVLAPTMPEALLRSISNNPYLLGFHAFDENQPYLIVKVDSYEQAFSGLLSWEPTMQRDLAPLFTRKAPIRIQEQPVETSSVATSTATTTIVTTQLLPSGFIDLVVENHDARVIQNSAGDILLLWTFLDRNTLVITTNEYTLREIITRLTNAPVTP